MNIIQFYKGQLINRNLWIILLIVQVIGISCQKVDIDKEKEAIKSVIEAEIKASFYGDYASWTKLLARKSITFWQIGEKEDCSYWKGWEEICNAARDFITSERTEGRIYEGYYNLNIKVYKKSAMVSYMSKSTIIQKYNYQEKEVVELEVRYLEKTDRNWKILYLGSLCSSGNKELNYWY